VSAPKTINSVLENVFFKDIDLTTVDFPFDVKNFDEIKEGDLIYSSGQPAEYIYLIVSGEVKIKINATRQLIVKTDHDFFGEIELMNDTPRNSSSLANKDSLIYKIKKNILGKLIKKPAKLETENTATKEIQTEQNDVDEIQIEVLETPVNIPESIKPHVVEPFVNKPEIPKSQNEEPSGIYLVEENILEDLNPITAPAVEQKESVDIIPNIPDNKEPVENKNKEISPVKSKDFDIELIEFEIEEFYNGNPNEMAEYENEDAEIISFEEDDLPKPQTTTAAKVDDTKFEDSVKEIKPSPAEHQNNTIQNRELDSPHSDADYFLDNMNLPSDSDFPVSSSDKTNINKSENEVKKVDPVQPKQSPKVKAEENIKSLISEIMGEKEFTPKVDLDEIEKKLYKSKEENKKPPDVDSVLQQKYIKSDDRSLKKKLIGDENEAVNWTIIEGQIDDTDTPPAKDEPLNLKQNALLDKKFGALLQPSEDIKQTVKEVLNFLIMVCDAEVASLNMYSPKEKKLLEVCQTFESIFKRNKPINEGITGLTIREKKCHFAVGYQNNKDFNPDVDLPNNFTGETIVFMPFVDNKDNVIGIAQLGLNKTVFSFEDRKEFDKYAEYVSYVLQKTIISSSTNFEAIAKTELIKILKFLNYDIEVPLLKIKHAASSISRSELPEHLKKSASLLNSQVAFIADMLQSPIEFFENSVKLKLEVASFKFVFDDTYTSLSAYVLGRNVTLVKETTDNSKVKIDTHKFETACHYIARFVCDVMPSGGIISFGSHLSGGKIKFLLKDNNKFVNANNIDKIVLPDFSNDFGENIGLSLSIAKDILKSMQCAFELELSDTGTNYLITIPIVAQ